ncbi:MAG: ATP-binding cassette domain-containing protein [Thermodesulfobacteriota bacterium]|nr:ATP-binding cassette domain-containing protein [Thermodesulfobacteriota bacterium]
MEVTQLKDYIVLIEDLTKKFRNTLAVDDLSLNIKRGEIFGLLGSDGAGKTTTIQMLCGILSPSSGLMFVDGHNVEKEPDAIRSAIGYMSQDFTLYLDMTVEENMDFMADLRGVIKTDREKQKKRLLQFSRMEPFRDRRAAALSGGMKKKLALSCALIHHPKVLILDEPTTGVDPLSRSELWRILYEFIVQGITVIISTPYMDEAERCHRLALIQDGRVIACDTPVRLKMLIRQSICSFRTDKINKACRILREDIKTQGQVYGDRIRVFLDNPDVELSRMEKDLADKEVIIEDCREVSPTMDDVFTCLLKDDIDKDPKKVDVPFKSHDLGRQSIVVSDLTKMFGDFKAVDNVSFEVRTGTVFGLLGPNGAGKTTTIKMLCGLLPPTSGKAMVAGYDVGIQPRLVKANIGYMSQLFSLYPDLTVEQNMDFYGTIYGLGKKEKKIKKEWVIELAGLKDKEKHLTGDLAGGWKQKLALGCAVMHQPAVLFLDEPTSGVDPVARIEFWDIIHRFSEEGITSIVTTHFMDEAERCNLLGLMNNGKLIALGTPEELKEGISTDFYEVSSSSVLESYDRLVSLDLICQAALFGDKIHILTEKSGQRDLSKEDLLVEDINVDEIVRIKPSLEDVFLYHVMASDQKQ